MIENMKVKVTTLAAEASAIRRAEVKKKHIMRYETHIQSFRHQKDQPKPEVREWPKEGDQEAYNDAWDKFWNLQHHRVTKLRKEARISHLAYAFLRGVPYKVVEQGTHDVVHAFEDQHEDTDERAKERRIFDRVKGMAKKFYEGDVRDFQQKWAEWVDDAKAHVLMQHPLKENKFSAL